MPVPIALGLHCLCTTIALGWTAVVLWRRKLLTLLHSGTWVLFSFALFFVFNPVVSLCTGDLALYEDAIIRYCGEGADRVFWVLLLVLVGQLVFFATYIHRRGPTYAVEESLPPAKQIRWSLPTILVVVSFIVLGALGVLFYSTRGEFVDTQVTLATYDHGKIIAGPTGYTVTANHLYIFPAMLLVFRGPSVARILGYLLLLFYVGLRLYDPWDRASIVSLIAAVDMIVIARRHWSTSPRSATSFAKLNRLLIFVPAVALAGMLIARGHTPISETTWHEGKSQEASEALVRNDTAMLPTLYARTNMTERRGFDYGVPVVTAVLFGWLPRQYFPWKDELTNVLLDPVARRVSPADERWIYGPKMTMIGCLYDHGGVIGITLCMFGLAFAARALDRLVAIGKTDLGRCVGIMWMSQLWIMFASGDVWTLNEMFVSGLPFFALLGVSRLQPRGLLPVASNEFRAKSVAAYSGI